MGIFATTHTEKSSNTDNILALLLRARDCYLQHKANDSLGAKLIVDLEELSIPPDFFTFFKSVVDSLTTKDKKKKKLSKETFELVAKEGPQGVNRSDFSEPAPSSAESAVFTLLQGDKDEQERALKLFDTLMTACLAYREYFDFKEKKSLHSLRVHRINFNELDIIRQQAKQVFYRDLLECINAHEIGYIACERLELSAGTHLTEYEFTLQEYDEAIQLESAWDAQLNLAVSNFLSTNDPSRNVLLPLVDTMTAVKKARAEYSIKALVHNLHQLTLEDIKNAISSFSQCHELDSVNSAPQVFESISMLQGLLVLKQSFHEIERQGLAECTPKFMACFRRIMYQYPYILTNFKIGCSQHSINNQELGSVGKSDFYRQAIRAGFVARIALNNLANYYNFTELSAAGLMVLYEQWGNLGPVVVDNGVEILQQSILALQTTQSRNAARYVLSRRAEVVQKEWDAENLVAAICSEGEDDFNDENASLLDQIKPSTRIHHLADFIGLSSFGFKSWNATSTTSSHLKRLLHVILLAANTSPVCNKVRVPLERSIRPHSFTTSFMQENLNTLCLALGYKACISEEKIETMQAAIVFSVSPTYCGKAEGLDFELLLAGIFLIFLKLKQTHVANEWPQNSQLDIDDRQILRARNMNLVRRHLLGDSPPPEKMPLGKNESSKEVFGSLPEFFNKKTALMVEVERAFQFQCQQDLVLRCSHLSSSHAKMIKNRILAKQQQAIEQLETRIATDMRKFEEQAKRQSLEEKWQQKARKVISTPQLQACTEMTHRAAFFSQASYLEGVNTEENSVVRYLRLTLHTLLLAQTAQAYYGEVVVRLTQGILPSSLVCEFILSNINAMNVVMGGDAFVSARVELGITSLVFSVDTEGCGIQDGPDFDALIAGIFALYQHADLAVYSSSAEESSSSDSSSNGEVLKSVYLIPIHLFAVNYRYNIKQLFDAARNGFNSWSKAERRSLTGSARKAFRLSRQAMLSEMEEDAKTLVKQQDDLVEKQYKRRLSAGFGYNKSLLTSEQREEVRALARALAVTELSGHFSREVTKICLQRALGVLLDAHSSPFPFLNIRDMDSTDWTVKFLRWHIGYANPGAEIEIEEKRRLVHDLRVLEKTSVSALYIGSADVDLEYTLLMIMTLMKAVPFYCYQLRCVVFREAQNEDGSIHFAEQGVDLFEEYGLDRCNIEELLGVARCVRDELAPCLHSSGPKNDEVDITEGIATSIVKCGVERGEYYLARTSGQYSPHELVSIFDVNHFPVLNHFFPSVNRGGSEIVAMQDKEKKQHKKEKKRKIKSGNLLRSKAAIRGSKQQAVSPAMEKVGIFTKLGIVKLDDSDSSSDEEQKQADERQRSKALDQCVGWGRWNSTAARG